MIVLYWQLYDTEAWEKGLCGISTLGVVAMCATDREVIRYSRLLLSWSLLKLSWTKYWALIRQRHVDQGQIKMAAKRQRTIVQLVSLPPFIFKLQFTPVSLSPPLSFSIFFPLSAVHLSPSISLSLTHFLSYGPARSAESPLMNKGSLKRTPSAFQLDWPWKQMASLPHRKQLSAMQQLKKTEQRGSWTKQTPELKCLVSISKITICSCQLAG